MTDTLIARFRGACHGSSHRRAAKYRQAAASPLHPHDRSAYLERVAELLRGRELGDGIVARAAREAQRQFMRAPELEPRRLSGRWAR
jgi:hypothetical protein